MGNFQIIFRKLRTSSRLTQNEMAEKLGISRSTIGMYETGAREPDFETLEKIADYFNVDTDFLLGRTEQTTMLPETIGSYSKTRELTEIYLQLSNNNQERVLTYSKSLLSTQQLDDELATATQYQQPTTLAAHHEGNEYTEDELKEIDQFKKMVENKRK